MLPFFIKKEAVESVKTFAVTWTRFHYDSFENWWLFNSISVFLLI